MHLNRASTSFVVNKLSVMFICTGNTCRSPMAEAYFRYLCEDNFFNQIAVRSAGINAIAGCDASKMAIKVMEYRGLSLNNCKSTLINDIAVRQTSIIIGMTNEHTRDIMRLFPHSKHKTRTLLSFSGSNADIRDPYGGNFETFEDCFNTMMPGLDALFKYFVSKLSP